MRMWACAGGEGWKCAVLASTSSKLSFVLQDTCRLYRKLGASWVLSVFRRCLYN